METATLTFEVAQARDAIAEWIVEAIDEVNGGEVYMTRFSGPDANQRAQEYADWKNGTAA